MIVNRELYPNGFQVSELLYYLQRESQHILLRGNLYPIHPYSSKGLYHHKSPLSP